MAATTTKPGPRVDDVTIRLSGLVIRSRPKAGPAVWIDPLTGRTYTHPEAVVFATRCLKILEAKGKADANADDRAGGTGPGGRRKGR